MNKETEKSGNALDAAPKGPRLPGKKKTMPPLPKQEPTTAPTTTPAPTPAPETPVSAVREIKEIGPSTNVPVAEVLAEMEKQGFTPAVFAGAAAETSTPVVEVAPVVAPTIELTLETPPPQPPEPSSRMQRAASVVDMIAAEVRQEATNNAPPATDSSTRMRSADSLLPAAEEVAANKNEEAFFNRGDRMGKRPSALRNRLRNTFVTHNHVTNVQPQQLQENDEMSRNRNVTSTPAAAPAVTPAAETSTATAPETAPPSTESATVSTPVNPAPNNAVEKKYPYGVLLLGALLGIAIGFFVGRWSVSTPASVDAKTTPDTSATASSTVATHTASTSTAPAVTTSATASTATTSVFTGSQPVSIQHHGRVKGPLTNELLAQVIAANHGKWSGTIDCFKTDWAPVDDDAPWVDCTSQKKKAIAGPQSDCFKVVNCDAVFAD